MYESPAPRAGFSRSRDRPFASPAGGEFHRGIASGNWGTHRPFPSTSPSDGTPWSPLRPRPRPPGRSLEAGRQEPIPHLPAPGCRRRAGSQTIPPWTRWLILYPRAIGNRGRPTLTGRRIAEGFSWGTSERPSPANQRPSTTAPTAARYSTASSGHVWLAERTTRSSLVRPTAHAAARSPASTAEATESEGDDRSRNVSAHGWTCSSTARPGGVRVTKMRRRRRRATGLRTGTRSGLPTARTARAGRRAVARSGWTCWTSSSTWVLRI
jgi:hypothetical protein